MLRWSKSFIAWLLEPHLFWLCIAVIGTSLGFLYFCCASEPAIRIVGLLLQLCGIGTVAWGLRETRKLFGHPHFGDLTLDWLTRFPQFNPKPITGYANSNLPKIKETASGYSWSTVDPEAPIEVRLSAIEANLSTLNSRFDHTQRGLDKEIREIRSKIYEEELLRQNEDQITSKKLEAAHTGGLRISAVGLVWLSFGLILSSTSVELAKYLN